MVAHTDAASLGSALRAAREEAGLSRPVLGGLARVTLGSLKNYESGVSEPPADAWERLSAALEQRGVTLPPFPPELERPPFPGELLRQVRSDAGLTQTDVERETGMGNGRLSPYERGRIQPSPHTWYIIHAILAKHGVEFPAPPSHDAVASVHPSPTGRGTEGEGAVAEPQDVPPGMHMVLLRLRRRAELAAGAWIHMEWFGGVVLGVRLNRPVGWELSFESRGRLRPELVRSAIRAMFPNHGSMIVVLQSDPSFARVRVMTPDLRTMPFEELREALRPLRGAPAEEAAA